MKKEENKTSAARTKLTAMLSTRAPALATTLPTLGSVQQPKWPQSAGD